MTFRGIVGHARVKALLSGAIARGSIPPTLLFAGPHGVGKTLVGQATAAALNCLSPVRTAGALPIDACGKCRACDRIARGVHLDVLRLVPDETAKIYVDQVRDVLERTGYRPFEGRRRAVVIEDADALLEQAQNALLKSLEEPPPATVFILTTAVPGVLLPTVRSRCMRLRFGRLSESEVASILEREHGFSTAEASEAAALADGNVRHAIDLGKADLKVARDQALQLLKAAAHGPAVAPRLQAAAALVGAGKNERSREGLGLVLRLAASMVRDIEVLKAGGSAQALANATVSSDLAGLAHAFGGDRARDAFVSIDTALAALERNAGTRVVADWLATQI